MHLSFYKFLFLERKISYVFLRFCFLFPCIIPVYISLYMILLNHTQGKKVLYDRNLDTLLVFSLGIVLGEREKGFRLEGEEWDGLMLCFGKDWGWDD